MELAIIITQALALYQRSLSLIQTITMADAAAAPAKKVVKKTTKPKKPATHPKYSEMIAAAITSLKDRTGSSGQAIKKYIAANYKVEEKSVGPQVRLALKRGVASGLLKQVKGNGASGSFKLAEKAAKPKKAATKKPAAKKPAAKKAAAKSPKKAAKKTTTKKTAAKKVKTPKKSTKKPAKSPAAKKPKAKKTKKPAAKKAAK